MVMTAPQRSGQHSSPEAQHAPSEEQPTSLEGQPTPRTPREFFESLPPTLCLRAEIIDGNLIMSPSGTPQHARIARRLSRALIPVEDKNDWESFSGDVDVCIEGPRDTLVPDYCLAPVNAPLWGDRELLSSTLIMVAEIVSPGSTDTDRAVKPRIYAGCGIPIVLIIDPVASPPAITVLSDPVEGTYRTTTNTEMGKPVRLPSPVDFDLDTSIFL
ncbi:Uma2 family endonuclease [Streptosporangium lutulentum]|uniref:Uma2 family endonuclease n=1 Tax=Streptosporangium lutulentum TaxID=1461250 RepID=A0ABT9Q2W3_9ACTN|nr:Uma2 family endonuclease [Streptosporangium lutulentum]MDP9841042.1 Uma2 family endonuclease [Streptosporangium lutulentum]